MKTKPYRSKLFIARGSDTTIGHKNIKTITDKHLMHGFNRSGVVVENGVGCIQNI